MADVRDTAKMLQENKGWAEILRLVKADIIKEWANTEATAAPVREAAYFELQAISSIERKISALVDDATIEARKAGAAAVKAGQITDDTW